MEHFDAEMLLTIIVGLCEEHFLALTRSDHQKFEIPVCLKFKLGIGVRTG